MKEMPFAQKLPPESARRIGALLEAWRGERTHRELAGPCGVTQGQISRILSGKFTRLDGTVLELCEMAGIESQVELAKAANSVTRLRLHKMLDQCWDGSKEQADSLINLLQSVGKLLGKGRNKPLEH